jgi:hypothetical protein
MGSDDAEESAHGGIGCHKTLDKSTGINDYLDMPRLPLPLRSVLFSGFFLFALPVGAFTESPSRHEAALNKDYHGAHEADFAALYDRVRLLVHQAQLEVSSRLGLLQYREGFQYPIMIHFEDGAPKGLESALAYVRLAKQGDEFEQELVVNLDELTQHPMNFDTVFYHEMTHAVMNDAVGGSAAMRIPHWLQEGLAQFVSGEGDRRVEDTARSVHKAYVPHLLYPLTDPAYGNGYPQYFLAVKYLVESNSINALQSIVRDLIDGKNLNASLQERTGFTWEQYQKNVRDYSIATFKDFAIPDGVVRF